MHSYSARPPNLRCRPTSAGSVFRAFGTALLVIGATLGLMVNQTLTSAYSLAATTVLVTSYQGNGLGPIQLTPVVRRYVDMAMNNYVTPGLGTPEMGTYNPVAVINAVRGPFQSLDQVTVANKQNLDNCIRATGCSYNRNIGSAAPQSTDSFVVFGYSESTVWATLEKRALAAQYPTAGTGPPVSFVLIGNLSRPNGGVMERNPIGTLVSLLNLRANGPTPTNTQYPTIDVTRQYDGASDAPVNPTNFLANLNAKMGFLLVHTDYRSVGLQPGGGALLQDQYGDTTYYMIPTPTLPLLMPLLSIPGGRIMADMLDPQLRVLVESGYDRTTSPGVPTPYDDSYAPDPSVMAENLALAKATGRDNFSEDIGLGRPLGTTRPDTSGQGAYGIGGPPVTMAQTTDVEADTTVVPTQLASSPTDDGTAPASAPADAATTTSKPLLNVLRPSFNASPRASNGTTATGGGSGLLAGAITATVGGIAAAVQNTVNSVASAIRKPLGAKPSDAKTDSGTDAG